MANRWGNIGNSDKLCFLVFPNHCGWWLHPWNEKTFAPYNKSCDKPRQHVKKQRHYFAYKGPSSQSYSFPVCMDVRVGCKESGEPKNWCFWTVVLEKTLESSLDCKQIKLVSPTQSWTFVGRTDAEAEASILWPPDSKSWLIGKDPDAGKDWKQEEKGMTEDEMVGWHHQLNGWVWERSWWWTEKSGVLQSIGLQRVRHDWVTELKTQHFKVYS